MAQAEQILRYLQTHKRGITPIDALRKFGCFRLGARIYDLRKEGHDIKTVNEPSPDGEKHWARYCLVKSA